MRLNICQTVPPGRRIDVLAKLDYNAWYRYPQETSKINNMRERS